MDEKIIKDSRVIDKIIKIKTIYNINHLINHFHLSKKNIKNLLEEILLNLKQKNRSMKQLIYVSLNLILINISISK